MKLTGHAVDRYVERLQLEHLPRARARDQLEALLALGHAQEGPPPWAREAYNGETPEAWWIVGDLALPQVNGYLVTCLVKGDLSPLARERRNRQRKDAAKRRRRHPAGPHIWTDRPPERPA